MAVKKVIKEKKIVKVIREESYEGCFSAKEHFTIKTVLRNAMIREYLVFLNEEEKKESGYHINAIKFKLERAKNAYIAFTGEETEEILSEVKIKRKFRRVAKDFVDKL